MAQNVNVSACKADNLSLFPRTHMEESENSNQLFADLYICTVSHLLM